MLIGLDPEHDPAAARDTALILLGYTAALRRSELAALTLADVTEHPDGAWIEIFLASSKTDQHRAGHTIRIPATGGPACPVAAWTRWPGTGSPTPTATAASPPNAGSRQRSGVSAGDARPQRSRRGIASGFRCAAHRPGRARRPLDRRDHQGSGRRRRAARHVVGALAARGFATQAYAPGVDELATMRHGRWRSAAVMRTYIAEADRHRADSPITALGLGMTSTSGDRASSDIAGSGAGESRR